MNISDDRCDFSNKSDFLHRRQYASLHNIYEIKRSGSELTMLSVYNASLIYLFAMKTEIEFVLHIQQSMSVNSINCMCSVIKRKT
ncbi:hypothetical protein D3C77_591410 [compost metagenome]